MTWDVLSTNEVAAELGVSRARVSQLVSAGKLTADRSGRSMLFERAEVDRYLATLNGAPGKADDRTQPQLPVSSPASPPEPPKTEAKSTAAVPAEVKRLQAENESLAAECRRLQVALDQSLALIGTLSSLHPRQ